MSKIYIPASKADDWAQLLAKPQKHWRQGYSARALAHCWQEAGDFPKEIQAVLASSPEFDDIKLLLAIPEHKVPLPGGSRSSQNDVWALARAGGKLVSIAVEGKVAESFGPLLGEWKAEASAGKTERLQFLCSELALSAAPADGIRYQLLHRAASAIVEAKRFNAAHAIVLVHSFSQSDQWFSDFENFVALFGARASKGALVAARPCNGISMHFAWVRGDARFLSM